MRLINQENLFFLFLPTVQKSEKLSACVKCYPDAQSFFLVLTRQTMYELIGIYKEFGIIT